MKLSKSNMKLLKFILENPGLSQLEIARKVKLSRGSISIFIRDAKKESLIFEIKSENKIKIHPTKLGKDIVIRETIKTLTSKF